MAKFNRPVVRTAVASPIKSTSKTADAVTYEGGAGFSRDAQSELFLLAVTNMVSEDTFYEQADQRDERFERLIAAVAPQDPAWFMQFVKWLRQGANMRSASLVAALEGARALVNVGEPGGRQMVSSALWRADEPSEALGYWFGHYGRKMPKPIKRGIADAAVRLYDERSMLKYDTDKHAFRFGDVLDLTHPEAVGPVQSAVFKFAIDRRHGRDVEIADVLSMTRRQREWFRNAKADEIKGQLLNDLINEEILAGAGLTWEDVLSALGGKVDKGELWRMMIPNMGYMALLRNLRNFDEHGVKDAVAQQVIARLQDPAQVAKSRQLPLRFLSAYLNAPSLRWAYPLEQALQHSLANVPALIGKTLIMIDTSSSMYDTLSGKSKLQRMDAATVFGLALAARAEDPIVVSFSNGSKVFDVRTGESVLKAYDRWKRLGYMQGGGTNTAFAIRQTLTDHDRVIILTDEQAAYDGASVDQSVPKSTWLHTFNLAGYRTGHAPSGSGTRHTFGGLTDACFGLIPLLERGADAPWPWEV